MCVAIVWKRADVLKMTATSFLKTAAGVSMRHDKAHIPFSRANTKDLARWIPGACGGKGQAFFSRHMPQACRHRASPESELERRLNMCVVIAWKRADVLKRCWQSFFCTKIVLKTNSSIKKTSCHAARHGSLSPEKY